LAFAFAAAAGFFTGADFFTGAALAFAGAVGFFGAAFALAAGFLAAAGLALLTVFLGALALAKVLPPKLFENGIAARPFRMKGEAQIRRSSWSR
jgi:hypothetical protein